MRKSNQVSGTAVCPTTPEILIKFAQSDLRKARRIGGGLMISETKQGLVELSYNAIERYFTVTSQDGGTFQKHGKAKDMAQILANEVYVVVR